MAPATGLFCRGIVDEALRIGPGPCSTQSGTPSGVIDMSVRSSSCSSCGRRDLSLTFLRFSLELPNSSPTDLTSVRGRTFHQRLRRLMRCSPDVDEGFH